MPVPSALVVTLLALNIAALPVERPVSTSGLPVLKGAQEVLARCTSPAGFHGRDDRLSARADDAEAPLDLPRRGEGTGNLVLVRDRAGLDIIQTDAGGRDTLWSASRSGSDLLDTGVDEAPYHLVLTGADGPEHFLFAVAADGNGELVWATASAMAVTECRAG